MRIEWVRIETENLLESLSRYQVSMESKLGELVVEAKVNMDEWFEVLQQDEIDLTPDEWFAQEQMAEDEYDWTYKFMFPRSLRYSYIVLLFLVIESELVGLCDDIKERRGIPLRANELKGDTIARTKSYLRKLAGLALLDDQLWLAVEDLGKVRNCIVHALGKVELSNDQGRLRELATKNIGLSISGDGYPDEGLLILTAEYCKSATQNVQALFTALFDLAGYVAQRNTSAGKSG